ncbi:MAG: hypothetical protein JWM47_4033 [Acidimicrobiales bacterium]|jgi:hypothetical protein|nr:hypothetical protein [Acidimicrobiales bacterium]
MPLYFFDITDTGKTWPDSEETELASLEETRQEALRTLGEIVKTSCRMAITGILRLTFGRATARRF